MTKWEYQSVRLRATYDWQSGEPKKMAFEISTAEEEIRLPPEETKILIELNRLGRQGWEIVSVNYDRLPDGVTIEYFLKRPLTE